MRDLGRMTLKELAGALGRSPKTIYDYHAEGLIPSWREGRYLLFDWQAVHLHRRVCHAR